MKKAKWIKHTHIFKADEYECPCCHAVCDEPYKTCPVCRSSMGGSSYDASWIDEMAEYDAMFDDDEF